MYRTTQAIQSRKDARRAQLLRAAAEVFSARGYHRATVKDVVERAAVSVGTFYFYFRSKEELFAALYADIAEEFDSLAMRVIDVGRFPMLKNYTRVMAATLWMYGRKRELARIMLEAAAAEPRFQALERARVQGFAQTMAGWFRRFRQHGAVNIPDEQVAALIYAGSYSCLVGAWLSSGAAVPLTEHAFAFCVYHLQALGIPFDDGTVSAYIDEVLRELDGSPDRM